MDHASHFVATYGYAIIFVLVFLDQAAVSIPSPPFIVAMGGLAATGRFNIYFAFATVFAAAFLADSMWYVIGTARVNGRLPIMRSKNWNEKLAKVSALLRGGVLGALITVKFSLLPSALAPFLAGSARVWSLRFFSMAGIANFTHTAVFLVGGFTANYTLANFFLKGNSGIIIATCACWFLLLGPAALQWTLNRLRPGTAPRRQFSLR